MEENQVSFKTMLSYGPDDNDEITVVINGLDKLTPKIEEIFNQKFDGVYFNDEFATYWAYDIPLAKGLTLDFNYYNDLEGIIYFDLVGDLDKLEEDFDEEESEESEDDNTDSNKISDDELHEKWIGYLKSKIDEDCNSSKRYEVYWDYRDELEPGTVKRIVEQAIENDTTVESELEDWLWEINDTSEIEEPFLDDVSKNIPEELEDYALDRDLYDDLQEAGYNGVDMNAKELLDNAEVKVNIMFATPEEQNSDMGNLITSFGSWKDPEYDYIVENTEVLDNAMTYLIHQQGHSLKEYYQCLLENPGGFDMKHKSTFIESCVDDCVNNSSDAMSGIMCLTRLTPYELYDLYKAMKNGTPNVEFSKDTYCGTVNIWAGSGGLGVSLEKPLIMPSSYITHVQVEGAKDSNYTVDEIFGLVGECWDGKMTFTNSQPDLYQENKEELIEYIKTLIPEDEKEED